MNALYFESHVTVEPMDEDRLEVFKGCCDQFKFRPAKLLMQKDRGATLERSNKDTFATGHSATQDDLALRMQCLVDLLNDQGFKVWRYKIEAVLIDVKLPRL